MAVLLIADHTADGLAAHTANALTAALRLAGEVDVLVAGENARRAAEQAATLSGVRRVLLAEGEALAEQLPEPLGDLIVRLAPGYAAVVAPASSSGKNVLPRVAALLDVMQVSDVIAVDAPNRFRRPVYAGNAIQTVETTDPITVLTVRTSAFTPVETGAQSAPIESIESVDASTVSRFVQNQIARSERPELGSAKIVIAGGRAFGSKEKFDQSLIPVAQKLGAAIGASRAAVDAGFAPNELQVGQTGRAVAPDLYIACGISGAIQHLAGMKDSRVVVAINSDPEAPIFGVADYGLVGDVFAVLAELKEKL